MKKLTLSILFLLASAQIYAAANELESKSDGRLVASYALKPKSFWNEYYNKEGSKEKSAAVDAFALLHPELSKRGEDFGDQIADTRDPHAASEAVASMLQLARLASNSPKVDPIVAQYWYCMASEASKMLSEFAWQRFEQCSEGIQTLDDTDDDDKFREQSLREARERPCGMFGMKEYDQEALVDAISKRLNDRS